MMCCIVVSKRDVKRNMFYLVITLALPIRYMHTKALIISGFYAHKFEFSVIRVITFHNTHIIMNLFHNLRKFAVLRFCHYCTLSIAKSGRNSAFMFILYSMRLFYTFCTLIHMLSHYPKLFNNRIYLAHYSGSEPKTCHAFYCFITISP